VRLLAPNFERFPNELRLYSTIEVPALPAVRTDATRRGASAT